MHRWHPRLSAQSSAVLIPTCSRPFPPIQSIPVRTLQCPVAPAARRTCRMNRSHRLLALLLILTTRAQAARAGDDDYCRVGGNLVMPTITGHGTINGTPGNDVIRGSNGCHVIYGKGGNDYVCALGGND